MNRDKTGEDDDEMNLEVNSEDKSQTRCRGDWTSPT